MTATRLVIGWAARAAWVPALLSACARSDATHATESTTQAVTSSVSAATTQAHAPEAIDARHLCERALPGADLINWSSATVAQFRSYQYGGPTPTVPLARVFPDLPGNARGAWCATGDWASSTHWWAVVAGRPAASLFTINGPGEGVRRGALNGPPQIP